MKQFIYLDHDVVNSIIAQAEHGIVLSILNEDSSSNSTASEENTQASSNAKVSGSILSLFKAEVGFGISRNRDERRTFGSASKDVVTKSLHDAAFDIAMSHIKPKIIMNDDSECDYGTFIEIDRTFDYIDLEYIEMLFSKEGLISYMKKLDKKKIEENVSESTSSLNREQFRKNRNKIQKAIKDCVVATNAQYDEICDIIKVFRKLVPYSRMLLSHDGFLMPLDDNYFRIDPCNLGFKYGGQMKCVGYITNLIGEDSNPNDETNIFASLQYSVNECLRGMLPTDQKNIYVVHPIALYYDTL